MLGWTNIPAGHLQNKLEFIQAQSRRDIGGALLWEDVHEDTWAVLKSNTTEEALETVDGVIEGDGLEAYNNIFTWFGASSDLALADRRASLMRPNSPRKDEEVGETIQRISYP